MKPIKVLVVDDSAFMRKAISRILEKHPCIKVVGTARDGLQAIEKISELDPDVVTLDINMPRMDGLATLKFIMKHFPRPVVMISSLTQEDAEVTVEALMHGAVACVPKPSGQISLDIETVEDKIIQTVLNAASANWRFLSSLPVDKYKYGKVSEKHAEWLIVIGVSTGGPRNLMDVIPYIEVFDDVAILIVQHMPPGFTTSFAQRLNSVSKYVIKEAQEGDEIKGEAGFLAPGGYHMHVTRKNGIAYLHIDEFPKELLYCPSVDVTMETAAEIFGPNVIGVIMTGMGKDGAIGMKKIKEKGGITIAEDKRTAVIFGMPAAAIKLGVVDFVLPSYEIPRKINKILRLRLRV